MRPVLLLDVDGPLSPFRAGWFSGRLPRDGYEFHELTPDGGITYRVALNPEHGRRIVDLADSGFDLAWASTWLHDANRLIAPLLGIPNDLPVIPLERPKLPTGRRCWKAPQILEWADGRPFAWFDDEINRPTRDWLACATATPHLAHRVEPHIGLMPADFESLATFLAGP